MACSSTPSNRMDSHRESSAVRLMQQRLVQARPFNVVRGQGVYGGIFRFDPFPRMRVIERTVLDPTGAGIETANIVLTHRLKAAKNHLIARKNKLSFGLNTYIIEPAN